MDAKTLAERAAFAKRLNWLVQTHGTTILMFCADMGIDRKTFYGWRSGEYSPTAKTLTRLAHKGVDINWLLTGKSLKTEAIEAEARRDRAMELLREVAPHLERHAQILHDRINAFLAERQGGAS